MKLYRVHVFSIIAEMIVEVEADSETEALADGRQMAEGRPATGWNKTSVPLVALIYVPPEGEPSD